MNKKYYIYYFLHLYQKNNMKTFSIGKVSVYLIIPFLVPVFYSIREVGFKNIYGLNFTQHPLLVSVIMFLSELVCGIKPLYKYCTNRNQKKEEITVLYNNEVLTGKEKENEEKSFNHKMSSFYICKLR